MQNRVVIKLQTVPANVVINATILSVMLAFFLSPLPAIAQAFTDLKDGLVDYSKADIEPGKPCEALNGYISNEIVRIKAEKTEAAGQTPKYCRVTGVLTPEIAFEVGLPARWNGRFYMFGNGGLAGQALDDPFHVAQLNAALQKGFAVAHTNTGHDARREPGGTFVMSNPQKAIDYAWRAVHLTAVTAREITAYYYSKPVSHAYWNSCSNGGRQGLIEAQRYPDDFDGIVANSPWLNQTGFTVGVMWNQTAISETPVTEAQLELVADKVMEKCDAIDGLKDGLIDDPRQCPFDPSRDVPSCKAGSNGKDCLTTAQATAIAKIYSGPLSNGKHIFPGFEPGSEAVTSLFGGGTGSGWMNVIVSARPEINSADFNLAENIMRYLVFEPPRPRYDYRNFDFDHDIYLLKNWGRLADARDPDLSVFRRHGGKLILTHGWSDAILQPGGSVDYYEQAVAENGPKTGDFFRLFMAPGMAHCGGGTGPNLFDPVTAIINWVEQGRTPDSMTASLVKNNKVVRTRPLCPYPKVARYLGKGSIDSAANFHCVMPLNN